MSMRLAVEQMSQEIQERVLLVRLYRTYETLSSKDLVGGYAARQ